jgi:type I restriction enzyme M protein
MVEADVVDIMVALPGQLFYSTQIPACLWFLARSKKPAGRYSRDRRGQVLFIDGRRMGILVDRTRRELTDSEIARIARTCQAWRGERDAGEYADIPGFCKSASLDEVRRHDHVLTPGRYVESEAIAEGAIPFAEHLAELQKELAVQFKEGTRLQEVIQRNLAWLRPAG